MIATPLLAQMIIVHTLAYKVDNIVVFMLSFVPVCTIIP